MKVRVILLFIIIPMFSYSQVTIGSGKEPEIFSVLELDSDKGGLRLNQLNITQKSILQSIIESSPNPEEAKGLTIYDIDTKTVQYWDGTSWVTILGTNILGEEGQFLKSNGEGKLPEWVTLRIPVVKKEDYYLQSSQTLRDEVGLVIPEKPEDMELYNLDDPINDKWEVIDGLTTKVTIPQVSNIPPGKAGTRISIQFQTGVQIGTGWLQRTRQVLESNNNVITLTETTIPAIRFAIGIFVDDKLKLARVDIIEANGGGKSFSVYTVMGTIEDLPPGEQTVKVAVRRRASVNMDRVNQDWQRGIAIGRHIESPNPDEQNFNPFMGQSSLRVDLYILNTDEDS